MNKDCVEKLIDKDIRLNSIVYPLVWIIGNSETSNPDGVFGDALMSGELDQLYDFSKVEEWSGGDNAIAMELMAEIIHDNTKPNQFFAHVSAPVKTPFPSGGGSTYSWGYFFSDWILCESIDDFVEKALSWEKKVNHKCYKKAS